tara:strand:- start:162 stop:728 length:567 start_codon:yes stop_codon:yes gene_type:complete
MSNYFSFFPTTSHDLKDVNRVTEVTNILRRFKFKTKVKDIVGTYYDYTMHEGDRMDTIAERYYGDSNLAWVILHFNDIVDPYYDLPLFGKEFTDYIVEKYGSVTTARATTKNYFQILQQEKVLADGTRIPRERIVVDLKTYNTLSASNRDSETAYDFEERLNEDKKNLKILDRRYINQLVKEVKSVLA